MNCNLYKVLNYLKNNNLLTVDDDIEKQIYFVFKLTIPDKFIWYTTLKISDDLTVKKTGIITRDEYFSIKYKSPETSVDFGKMGPIEFKTTLANVEFNDNEDIVAEHIKQYITYDKDFLSYIK